MYFEFQIQCPLSFVGEQLLDLVDLADQRGDFNLSSRILYPVVPMAFGSIHEPKSGMKVVDCQGCGNFE